MRDSQYGEWVMQVECDIVESFDVFGSHLRVKVRSGAPIGDVVYLMDHLHKSGYSLFQDNTDMDNELVFALESSLRQD